MFPMNERDNQIAAGTIALEHFSTTNPATRIAGTEAFKALADLRALMAERAKAMDERDQLARKLMDTRDDWQVSKAHAERLAAALAEVLGPASALPAGQGAAADRWAETLAAYRQVKP